MEEKFGAIWIEIEEDGSAKVVFEQYLSEIQKLHLIYQQANGSFLPFSFVKSSDPQWRLPLWVKENGKAILPTIESAKEYLECYTAAST